MTVFAVKYPGHDWKIAIKQTAHDHAVLRGFVADNPEWEVWTEQTSKAFIGYVGNGEKSHVLEEGQADGV